MKNAEKLLFALNNVDNKYIDEANNREKEKKNISGVFEKIGAVAAVLVLVAFAVVVARFAQKSNVDISSGSRGNAKWTVTEDKDLKVDMIEQRGIDFIFKATAVSSYKGGSFEFYDDDARALASFFSPVMARAVKYGDGQENGEGLTLKFFFKDGYSEADGVSMTIYVDSDLVHLYGDREYYMLNEENRAKFNVLLSELKRKNYGFKALLSTESIEQITEAAIKEEPGEDYYFEQWDAINIAQFFTSLDVVSVSDTYIKAHSGQIHYTVKIKHLDGAKSTVHLDYHYDGAEFLTLAYIDGKNEYYKLESDCFFIFRKLIDDTAKKSYDGEVTFLPDENIKLLDKVRVFYDYGNVDYEFEGEYAALIARKFAKMKSCAIYNKNYYKGGGFEIQFSFTSGYPVSLYYNGKIISEKGSDVKFELEEAEDTKSYKYYLSYLFSMQNATEDMPDDFSFCIQSWSSLNTDIHIYDSASGRLSKTAYSEAYYKMTDAELKAIYNILFKNIDIFSYPDEYDPCNSPNAYNNSTIIIKVRCNGMEKTVECRNIAGINEDSGYNRKAKAFLKAYNDIKFFLNNIDEWKALPECRY